MHIHKKGFTLVELIVVITILAILWTIAFISLQWYAANARDSVRIQDIANIKKSMELFVTESWLYPNPSDSVDITYSWWIVWSQWTVWDSVVENLWKLNKKPVDPVLATEYSYSRTNNKTEYELSGILEWWWVVNNTTINQTHAATQYRALVWWNYNGQVLKVSTWWLDYLLALPSITTTDTATTDIVTTTTNKSLVYNGEYNLPSNYSWVEWFTTTWWFEYAPSDIVAFSWPREELELASGKIKFIRNLQTAYSWSILSLKSEFTELLSFDAQTDVDTAREIALWMFQNVPQFNKNLQSTTFEPSFVWWLQLWLDADADYTITKDGSNKVSQWNDKSGNENHATQWVWANQPTYIQNGLNSKPSLDFERNSTDFLVTGNSWVDISASQDRTLFLVVKPNAIDGIEGSEVFGTSTSRMLGFWNYYGENLFRIRDGSVNVLSSPETVLKGYSQIIAVEGWSGSTNAWKNNSTLTWASELAFNYELNTQFGIWWSASDAIAQWRSFDGKVSEVILYNKKLTISERNKVNTYLAKKWWIDVPPFNPSSLSWLELWLDANDASTITKDGSNKVSEWRDKSGNGNNATQSTPSNQLTFVSEQLNGKSVLSGDGTDRMLFSSDLYDFPSGDSTIFVVVIKDATTSNRRIFTAAISGSSKVIMKSTSTGLQYYNNLSFDDVLWIVDLRNWNIIRVWKSGVTQFISVNGWWNITDTAWIDVSGINEASLFSHPSWTEAWDGDIAEFLIYNKALDESEVSQIESYLKSKWWL